jgi:signal transduction histidine kinase/ActR/RegA family two-component response regulator
MDPVIFSVILFLAVFACWQMAWRWKVQKDLKATKERLHLRERKVRTILDHAPIVFSAIDTKGIFLISEGKGLEKLGRKSNQSVGLSIYEMHNKNPIILDAVAKALSGQNVTTSFVLNDIAYELYIGPLSDTEGNITGASMLSVDITDRKKIEGEKAQLLVREQTAIETSKLKSEFLANMSHEIRTPLNGVLGMTSLLLDTPLSPEQKEFAQAIQQSGSSLLSVINDILDFSKIEAGKLDFEKIDFDLRQLVQHAMKGFRFAANPKGLTLVSEIDPSIPNWVKGDPNRFRQILNNLVSNAIKFTQKGQVTVRLIPESSAIDTRQTRIRFEIEDTGIGLSEAALQRMFIAFSQAEASMSRRYGGTGLGLSISKQLAEKMGGDIGVNSVEQTGSTFWFTLPFEIGQSQALEIDSLKSKPEIDFMANSTRPKILVTEDNRVNQMITVRMLEKMGCQAQIAEDGYQAIAALEASDFDLVLMDCQMPNLDGLDATRKIRASNSVRNPRIPILAMTANAMKGDKEKCIESGMDDYVSKPIAYDELALIVRQWLEMRQKKSSSAS